MAASATLALKAGVWFRRGRLLIVSPDSSGTACPLSGRNSTYRPVQISGTGSDLDFMPRPGGLHPIEAQPRHDRAEVAARLFDRSGIDRVPAQVSVLHHVLRFGP